MTFYYIIAESEDDYTDYLERFKVPESETSMVKIPSMIKLDANVLSFRNRPLDIHYLHITKFASKIDECKTKFIDLQIALSQNLSNVKTCIETEDGVVVSANISFLKL